MSYNSNVILRQIHAIQQRQREITSSIASSFSLLEHISHEFREIVDYEQHILTTMKHTKMSNDFRLTLKRYTKESIASIYSREFVKFDLNQSTTYQQARLRRTALLDTIVSKSNSITVRMIRFNKRKRKKNEMKKAKHTLKIAKRKLQKKQDKTEKKRLKF